MIRVYLRPESRWHKRFGRLTTLHSSALLLQIHNESDSPTPWRRGFPGSRVGGRLLFPLPDFRFGKHRRLSPNRIVYGWAVNQAEGSVKNRQLAIPIPRIPVTVQPGEPRQVAKAMRAINESSGEIKWRASEGCLQSVKHAEALFTSGVYIGADGAKVLSAPEGAKAA
jgi:hypothetical protein